MKKTTLGKNIRLTALFYFMAVAGILVLINACTHKSQTASVVTPAAATNAATPLVQGKEQTKTVTVLGMNAVPGSTATRVIFRELEEEFNVSDAGILASLKSALNENTPVKITFNPWQASVTSVSPVSEAERMVYTSRTIVSSPGSSVMVDLDHTDPNVINNAGIGVLNTTTPGLTSVIPNMATAQLMFDYITHQCCALPGPYTIDFCIPFQYCEDGCYARAHKMCYIINTKYNYATHKVFSFAYPDGPYSLCVKGEKWGGCCINWWYHVAPLVNIKTPSGTQAYVIDPAMFDQPVLLATWLHAQQNPACAGGSTPKVTSFNIQPTSSYEPYDTSSFNTDPYYAQTDTTLVNYSPLTTCP